jgi:hypothetical protein
LRKKKENKKLEEISKTKKKCKKNRTKKEKNPPTTMLTGQPNIAHAGGAGIGPANERRIGFADLI